MAKGHTQYQLSGRASVRTCRARPAYCRLVGFQMERS
jgi:hypothetical protein